MKDDADLNDGVLVLDIHLGRGYGLDDLRRVPGQVELHALQYQLLPIVVLDVFQHVHELLYPVQLAAQVAGK